MLKQLLSVKLWVLRCSIQNWAICYNKIKTDKEVVDAILDWFYMNNMMVLPIVLQA